MKIDVSKPEGNTLAALGIATQFLKKSGRADEIGNLRLKVFAAGSAAEARQHITDATAGAVTFFDGSKAD